MHPMRIKPYCIAILLLPVLLAAAPSLETFAGRKVLRIDIEGHQIPVGVQRAVLENAGSRMSLGRGGTPEEAAGAVYLLCIPESNYITGQLLMCDGGR